MKTRCARSEALPRLKFLKSNCFTRRLPGANITFANKFESQYTTVAIPLFIYRPAPVKLPIHFKNSQTERGKILARTVSPASGSILTGTLRSFKEGRTSIRRQLSISEHTGFATRSRWVKEQEHSGSTPTSFRLMEGKTIFSLNFR